MNSVVNQTVYRAFGLRMASEFDLRELIREADQEAGAEVEIKREDLSEARNAFEDGDDLYAYRGEECLLHVAGTALFSIRGGNTIGVDPMPGADERTIRLYLLGSCMGALLIQRKTLPLHGSAVVVNGKAYAITGDSGAGKSTLASAFVSLGYPLLSDDVIAVTLTPDWVPYVEPAYPQQKLWQQSIELLGMDAERYSPIYLTKFAVPVASRFCKDPVPLAGVFELAKTDGEEAEILPLDGLVRLPTLQYHTFRQFMIPPLGLTQWHFSTCTSIAGRIGMYRIRRPAAGFDVHELAAMILRTVEEGEKIPQR